MSHFVRRLIKQIASRKEISPQSVARELTRRGVPTDQITGAHLARVYKRMKRIVSAPDFAAIGGLLPEMREEISGCPVLGVIVETRKHPALEFVVLNVNRTLDIPIQLFHGRENLEFIMASGISVLIREGKVRLVQLQGNLDASKYNALLMTKDFWSLLGSRGKILVFQTDTIVCEESDYALSDFMSFDYIGSKWPRKRPIGLVMDGGNGGLSLRDWGKSYECLVRFPPEAWRGGEDGYFAFHMDLIGGRVGRDEDCARFCTQYEFLRKSLGAHKISCLDQASRTAFLEYCKNARVLYQ